MRLIYHPDAEAELIKAAQFYERRVSTLGAQFLDTADRAIAVGRRSKMGMPAKAKAEPHPS